MATVRGFAASMLDRHPVGSRVDLHSGDCHIQVQTNSPELRDKLADYFRPWLVFEGTPDVVVTALESDVPELDFQFVDWERDAGKTGRKDTFCELEDGRAVRKVRTGMQYLLGQDHKLVFGEAVRNYNQVVNFVVAQLINWHMHRGTVLCHAAGITRGGRGLALAGVSGAGKSTLALRLVTRGLAFTSNDRLLIGRSHGSLSMSGVPKQPRVNPGTLVSIPELTGILPSERRAEVASLSEDELFELEEKYDVDIERVFGPDRWELTAPLAAFLVLRWSRRDAAPTRFSRVDLGTRRDVLAAIMKPPGPFFQPHGDAPRGVHRQTEEEYLSCFDGLPVYEATGCLDFEAAMRFCLSELLPEATEDR